MSLLGQSVGAGAALNGGYVPESLENILKRRGLDLTDATIQVNKKIKLNGGLQIPENAGVDKVLVSDADGNATWQENSGSSEATTISLTSDNSSGTYYLPFAKTSTGNQPLYTDDTTTPLTYNPSTSTLTCTTFAGNLSGNATSATTAASATTATSATNTTNVALTSDNSAGTYYLPFAKTSTGNQPLYTDDTTTPLTYNPSTSTLTCSFINATTVTSSSYVKGYFYYYNNAAFALAAVDTLPINGSIVSGTFNYVTELGIEKIVIPNTGYYSFQVYYLVEINWLTSGTTGNGDSYLNIVIDDIVQPLYGRFNRVEYSDKGWSINYNVQINCNANSKVWFNHFHSTSMDLVSKTVNASGITTCPAVQIYAQRLS